MTIGSIPKPPDRIYFRVDGTAWVGEQWVGRYPEGITHFSELPTTDDPRWIPGKPSVQDEQVVTLCPFNPSGRLGICIEMDASRPLLRGIARHPPFAGAKWWMPLNLVRDHAVAVPAR